MKSKNKACKGIICRAIVKKKIKNMKEAKTSNVNKGLNICSIVFLCLKNFND